MRKQTKTLVFTHIPKTGGVTTQKIIQRKHSFTKGRSFHSFNVKQLAVFSTLPAEQKRQIQLVTGHLHFGVHKELQRAPRYFTMLREPLARAISEYNFICSYKHHSFYKEMNERKYSLEDFIQSGKILNMDNCQVRYLCGVSGIPYGRVNEEHLELAINNLTNYYETIGITEFFDESLILFARALNWKSPFYTRQNVNKSDRKISVADLDAKTLELIKNYNKYDSVLYAKALEIFEEQKKKAGPSFSQDVSSFKIQNQKKRHFTAAVTILFNYINRAKINKIKPGKPTWMA